LIAADDLAEETDVPHRFTFGGACQSPGPCPRVTRSAPLPAAVAARLGSRVEESVVAAVTALARKYSGSEIFRIGVRRASWPAGDGYAPLTVTMPSSLTAEDHCGATTAALARLTGPTTDTAAAPAVLCTPGPPPHDRLLGDLLFAYEIRDTAIVLHATAHEHIFDGDFTGRALGHLLCLIDRASAAPDTPLGGLDALTDGERQELRGFNDTRRPYPRDTSITALFAEQAAEYADRIAVAHGVRSLTYAELAARSDELAAVLHARGVRRHDRVALLLDRSPTLLVAILAVLRLGAAYVSLDPHLPPARRDFLTSDSGARLLLAERPTTTNVPVLDLGHPLPRPGAGTPPAPAIAPDDAAYVMYTSGTTGTPKGVQVPQRAVIRLVRGIDFVRLTPDTRILQTGAIGFDATTLEFWGALLNGGTVVLAPTATIMDTDALRHTITEHGVNTLWLTSALFNQIVDRDPTVLAHCQVLVGGEALSPRHTAAAMDACPDSVFVNGYGPTENTTFSTTHRIIRRYSRRVPIGRPIANSTAWVLDLDGNCQPVGVPGELHVGGDGLCIGYVNRPELDEVAFARGGLGTPERLYRTGDLAYWMPDGTLEYLGRADEQVKISGYRVEPGEVEHHLTRLPSVQEAVVLLRPGPAGDPALCAYFTAERPLDAAELRAALAAQLPAYMVPTAYLQLDRIPLNRNHKADREALAALEPVRPVDPGDAGRAPRDEQEAQVADVFAEILGLPSVPLDADFFDLGGSSLRMMRLWNRVRAVTGKDIELKQMLDKPTVAAVADLLARSAPAAAARPKLRKLS
jgi:amino acid adenylation domain-containing protein